MTPVIKISDSYTSNTSNAISAAEVSAVNYAIYAANTAYSNAVIYVNNRTLNDILDVNISNVADGDFLRYNQNTSEWINDPVNLATDTVGNYVESLVAGTGITLTNAAASEGGTPTIAVAANTFDAFGAAAAAQSAAVAHADTVANTAYSNAVSYVNSRTINDLFDVTISGVSDGDFLRYSNSASAWINDPVNLATDTVGNYVESLTAGTGITLTNAAAAEGGTPTIAVTENTYDAHGAAAAALANAVAHANIVANTAYSNSIAYVNSRQIGDLSNVSISNAANGDFLRYNGNVWINDPVNLSTDTVGDYVANLTSGAGITITNLGGEGANPTIAVTEYTYDWWGAAMNAQAAAMNYTDTVANTVYSNAVTYVNNRVLDNLLDVTLSNTANGDFLRYSSASNTWINDAINLSTDTIGDYVANVIAGDAIEISNTGGEGSAPTISVAPNSIDANHLSFTFEYIEDITAGTNMILTDDSVGINSNRIYSISTSATPNFTSVSTGALSINEIEIDPTGVTNGQILKYSSTVNKFIASNDAYALVGGTSATPNFTSVSTGALSINEIEIDPTGVTHGQILKYSSTVNKFIASDDLVGSGQAGTVAKYTETFYGNGTLKTIVANHNLNSTNVIVQIIDASSKETIEGHVIRTGVNSITATFQTPIPNLGYTVIVIG